MHLTSPLLVSATNREPLGPSARPLGSEKEADWPCPSAEPAVPVPATVDTLFPSRRTCRHSDIISWWFGVLNTLNMLHHMLHASEVAMLAVAATTEDLAGQDMSHSVHSRSVQGAYGLVPQGRVMFQHP